MRKSFFVVLVAAALFLSGCDILKKGGGTSPSPNPGPAPDQRIESMWFKKNGT